MKPQDLLGRCFVWEPSSPNALAMVVVTEVKWNGEEWWVTTCELTAGYTYWNTLERFNEATKLNPLQIRELEDCGKMSKQRAAIEKAI